LLKRLFQLAETEVGVPTRLLVRPVEHPQQIADLIDEHGLGIAAFGRHEPGPDRRELFLGAARLAGPAAALFELGVQLFLPRIDSGVSCLQIPLLLDSYEELDYVRDRLAPLLERRIEERGFVVVNWSDAGWVHFFTKSPAATPDDLRQLKLLTSAGDPQTEKLYKDFGLHVVPLPYTEVLMALETGLIEAVQGPPLYAMLDQWFGLAPNMTDLRWAPLVGATVIRRDTWEAIPQAWREEMLESARAAGLQLRGKIRALGEEAVPEMEKRGLKVVSLDEAALRAWSAETTRAYQKLRGVYAPADLFDEAVRLRDELRETASP